jgi:hypothetical protein
MSTPTPARPPAPVSPTRQQLDELEALMQRMLALPVHPLEAETEPAPEAPAPVEAPVVVPPRPPRPRLLAETAAPVPEPLAVAAAPPDLRQETASFTPPFSAVAGWRVAEEPAEDRAPLPAAPLPAAAAEEHSEEPSLFWLDEPETEPRRSAWLQPLPPPTLPFREGPPLPRAPALEWIEPEAEPAEAIADTYRSWRPAPTPAWLQPLVAFNAAFDWGVSWLGPLGRWLRTPGGRAALGWIGLVLLAAALALAALDGMGWTW